MVTTCEPVPATRILPPRPFPAQLRSAIDAQCIATLPVSGDTTLGRAPDRHVQLVDDPYVSAWHAVIAWDDLLGMHVILDSGSRNGTFVDDVQVAGPVRLVNGATIRLGMTELIYCAPRARQ